MTNATSRSLRQAANRKELTLGDLVAAFYDEAQQNSHNQEEADRLAKASLTQCLRLGHVRVRRGE